MNILRALNQNKAFLAVSSIAFYYGYNQVKDLMMKHCKCQLPQQKQKKQQKPKSAIKEMNRQETENQIYKICLTGGPCGGKTTAMTELKEMLQNKGFKVFCVPEIPTMTMLGGGMIIMEGLSMEAVAKFQTELMKMVMAIEDHFTELAILANQPCIILCDRGVIDPRGYMSDEIWQIILDQQGWNVINLRDRRYDAVIHLVTAADGAETFYSSENNTARYENVPQAIALDKKLYSGWIGHPHLTIIDNKGDGFPDKLKKIKTAVLKFIGLPVKNQFFKKYLIEQIQNFPAELKVEEFQVEEIFIKSENPNELIKIRKRGQFGVNTFQKTITTINLSSQERQEVKTPISAQQYMILLEKMDQKYSIIRKIRKCFVWDRRTFIIDKIVNGQDKQMEILRFELNDENEEIQIPTFLKSIKEITSFLFFQLFVIQDDKQFSTVYIAEMFKQEEKQQSF